MIIDTSVMIAILFAEPDRTIFTRAILDDKPRKISTASYLEALIVLSRRHGEQALSTLDLLVEEIDIKLIPLDTEQAKIAGEAYLNYGKGRHPAGLNFGDCFSYALAKVTQEPLLFKGDDFSRTDIVTVDLSKYT